VLLDQSHYVAGIDQCEQTPLVASRRGVLGDMFGGDARYHNTKWIQGKWTNYTKKWVKIWEVSKIVEVRNGDVSKIEIAPTMGHQWVVAMVTMGICRVLSAYLLVNLINISSIYMCIPLSVVLSNRGMIITNHSNN
jgi:hypothetical protein